MPMNLTSTLTAPVMEARGAVAREDWRASEKAVRAAGWAKRVERVMLAVAAIFFALHFVHLRADFPNHSAWMDWSKYTDEGWYGDAAIRHYQRGHWYLPGDFNAAVALPVWPAMEMALFRVTGVSLTAARALTVMVFGLSLACCYGLIRRWSGAGAGRRGSLAAALAVLLLSVNPFCFAFARLAILEPMLVLLALTALLAASEAGRASAEAMGDAGRWRMTAASVGWAAVLGVLLPLMVLTKTTGVFLFPAIVWLAWASSGYRVKPFLVAVLPAGVIGFGLWGAYYGLLVRPRYLMDYRYLFSANAYTGITRATLWAVIEETVMDTAWIGGTLLGLSAAAAVVSVASLFSRRARGSGRLGASPLAAALLLWVFGYGAFLAYHDNLQPRYYLVLATPLSMLVAMIFGDVLEWALSGRGDGRMGRRAGAWGLRAAATVSGVALAWAAFNGARQTIGFVRHPEYTWVNAAAAIAAAVERGPGAEHSRTVLSISGSDLSLMTGLRTICDDFGTMTLPDRLAAYKPGWFATWNDVEDDKMEALAPMYRLVRVMSVAALDDPERNLLILYRLDPLATPGPAGRPGRRRSLAGPRALRTKVGEQPTALQLKH
jgi:4-amino-4-deoxy-L-arabinose transferase-like glycosyltransferase